MHCPSPRITRERPYDAEAARRFWRTLIQVTRVLGEFRTGFLGKASPIHFFWGSFDLASTRFSGRVAPRHPGGMPGLPDAVTCEAYSHEEASIGFWPGSDAYPARGFLRLCLSRARRLWRRAGPAGGCTL